MPRTLSIVRRRPGIVDLTIQRRSNVSAYVFEASSNFNGVFSAFAVVPVSGLKSASIVPLNYQDSQFRGLTRFTFDPNDYTATVAAVVDDAQFWIRIKPVDLLGVVGTAETPHLVLPYSSLPNRFVSINGVVDTSVTELLLPTSCSNINIAVDLTDVLYVAMEPNAPEFPFAVAYGGTFLPDASVLFIRGSSMTTTFYLQARYDNQIPG